MIDASHPQWEEQRAVVDQVLGEMGVHGKPMLQVFNKTDRLSHDDLTALQVRLGDGAVFVSAVERDGLEPLRRALLGAGGRALATSR